MVANATVFISIFGATSGLMASKVGHRARGGGHMLECGRALCTGRQGWGRGHAGVQKHPPYPLVRGGGYSQYTGQPIALGQGTNQYSQYTPFRPNPSQSSIFPGILCPAP